MRDLTSIDADIEIERQLWYWERRAGDHCPEAAAALHRIDRFLDERTDVVRTLPDRAPRAVDARVVPHGSPERG
jgi:hypothetical protein